VRSEASFLTGGDSFAFDLPDEVERVPDLHSVLLFKGVGRFVTYRPAEREPHPRSNRGLDHRFDFTAGGRRVSVYRALDESTTTVANWFLNGGVLQTFVDDRFGCGDDTEERIRTIVSSLTIETSAAGLPVVKPRDPVFRSGGNKPASRERLIYFPRDPEARGPNLYIWNEPAWVPQGSRAFERETVAFRSETNDLNITVEAWGPREQGDELARQVKRIAASAVPLD
jgi:hypothetical protein